MMMPIPPSMCDRKDDVITNHAPGNCGLLVLNDDRATELWNAYVAASEKAQISLRFEDGLVAGKAWREFMKEFERE